MQFQVNDRVQYIAPDRNELFHRRYGTVVHITRAGELTHVRVDVGETIITVPDTDLRLVRRVDDAAGGRANSRHRDRSPSRDRSPPGRRERSPARRRDRSPSRDRTPPRRRDRLPARRPDRSHPRDNGAVAALANQPQPRAPVAPQAVQPARVDQPARVNQPARGNQGAGYRPTIIVRQGGSVTINVSLHQ